MAARRGALAGPTRRPTVPRLNSGVVSAGKPGKSAETFEREREEELKRSEAPTLPPPSPIDPLRGLEMPVQSAKQQRRHVTVDERVERESPGESGKFRRARRREPEANLDGAVADTVTADLRHDPRSEK